MELRKYAVYFSDDCIFMFEATDIVSAMNDASKYAYGLGIFVRLVEPLPPNEEDWRERKFKKNGDDLELKEIIVITKKGELNEYKKFYGFLYRRAL